MIICVPAAHVYRYPDITSEHIDEAVYGTECEILDEINGFYRVDLSYGYRGYVLKSDICAPAAKATRIVSLPFADLLYTPENRRSPRLTLPMGSLVDASYSEHEQRYAFVALPDNRIYFMHKNALSPIPVPLPEEETRDGIAECARAFLGVQYRWGGKTPAGVDCSGLAFMCYAMNGRTIYRDADIERSQALKKIDYSQADKGDLLFFEGHVAVCVGGGRFIHASAGAGRVCFGSIEKSDPLYSRSLADSFICAGTLF